MQSVEQTLRQRHVEVRNRLWPILPKQKQNALAQTVPANDSAEAKAIREKKLADERLQRYRVAQRQLEERQRQERESLRRQQRLNAELREKQRKERAARRANPGPDWEEIEPKLINGTMEFIRDQIMEHFPKYTFDEIKAVNRDPARGKVLRLIITAIRHLNPDVCLEEIGAFVERDRSTLSWHLRKTHLRDTVKKRRFLRDSLDSRIEEIRTMFFGGMPWKQIAKELDISDGSVGKFIKRHGWTRPNSRRPNK